jgi:hypothetical protein
MFDNLVLAKFLKSLRCSVSQPTNISVKFWRFRAIAALMLACSACKPLLNTDSSPASPEIPNPLAATQAIALARPYSQSGVSFSPPAQWQSVKIPGLKYAAFLSDPASPSSSSISLMEDRNPMSLANYIESNLKDLKTAFPNSSKFQNATFITKSGLTGTVVSTESQQSGKTMRQRLYFFASTFTPAKELLGKELGIEKNSDRKLVAVCTGTIPIEATCNASIKTLTVSP